MNLKSFDRQLGGGAAPLLGSDVAPNAASDPAVLPQPDMTNILAYKPTGTSGQPVRNVMVCTKYVGAGPYVAVTATMWFYEQSTNRWYTMESSKTLAQDQVTRFLAPAPLDPSAFPDASGKQVASVGGIQAYLQVSAAGAANGIYSFAMAADAAG